MASLLDVSGSALLNKGLPQGAVDMGLPSGTLWAQGNIIKDAQGNYAIGEPTDYGCYFSWGNIDGHNAGDSYNFSSNYDNSPGKRLTSDIPINDASHDAAVARLGNGWCMPTKQNFIELLNSANTTHQWTTINGVAGRLLTSVKNGNTIFFPASGYWPMSNVSYKNIYGFYWSRTFYNNTHCYSLSFTESMTPSLIGGKRSDGFTIRPVI